MRFSKDNWKFWLQESSEGMTCKKKIIGLNEAAQRKTSKRNQTSYAKNPWR